MDSVWQTVHMRRYFAWILERQTGVLFAIFVVSVFSFIGLSKAVVSTSPGDLFFGDAPEYLDYLDRIKEFGSDEVIAVAYQEEDPLSLSSLDRLASIQNEIKAHPEVKSSSSLLDLERIKDVDGTLYVEKYADLARENPGSRRALEDEIRRDPLLEGRTFSRSGPHALFLI